MKIAEIATHTKITQLGINIRHTGIANGKSMMKHWARCHGHNLTALDNIKQRIVDGTDVKKNNASSCAHRSDKNVSKGHRNNNTAV